MRNVKVLDCTLRDGGYVNNWAFGQSSIINIISALSNSKIDYIEYGFLQEKTHSSDTTIFNTISQLDQYAQMFAYSYPLLMINFGEYEITRIPNCSSKNIGLRVAFKKYQLAEAIEFCNLLVQKGYDVFVNPMHTSTYELSEWECLINKVNDFLPKVLTIVDTNGAMREYEVLSYYNVLNELLDKKVSIGFHSHNNLQLSLLNSKCLIDVCNNRELIIDSTLMGMGRGAGNLATEVITRYLNDNHNGDYDLNMILRIIEKEVHPIYAETPWNYSLYYYLAAIYNCHPNYAKYVMEKTSLTPEQVKEIFSTMPIQKRTLFDKDYVKFNCKKMLSL